MPKKTRERDREKLNKMTNKKEESHLINWN